MTRALFALLLLCACGPDYCPRVSQHATGWRCYEEEVGQEPCSVTTTGRLSCVEEPPDPLGGTARTGLYFWRLNGKACAP